MVMIFCGQTMRFLGVDTGGTFTEFVFVEKGEVRTLKIPSTPENPSKSFLSGLSQLTDEKSIIFHRSTVATNTMLENKGTDVLFLITLGFRDLFTLGHQNRPRLYALHPVQERWRLSKKGSKSVCPTIFSLSIESMKGLRPRSSTPWYQRS